MWCQHLLPSVTPFQSSLIPFLPERPLRPGHCRYARFHVLLALCTLSLPASPSCSVPALIFSSCASERMWSVHTMEYNSAVKGRNSCHTGQRGWTWRHDAKWNQPNRKTNTVWSHLQEALKRVTHIETESGRVLAQGWGEETMGSCCSSGIKLQFCKTNEF